MRAIEFREFGDFSQLQLVDRPDPRATGSTAVVRMEAASVNPSDVKNRWKAKRTGHPDPGPLKHAQASVGGCREGGVPICATLPGNVPDGDWFKDFGTFKLCGGGKYPSTFLLADQPARGKRL
jgi:hypothetical protein